MEIYIIYNDGVSQRASNKKNYASFIHTYKIYDVRGLSLIA